MPISFQDVVRRVVPRWRSLDEAIASKELDSFEVKSGAVDDTVRFIRQKELDWSNNKELFFALDLVNAATALGVGGDLTIGAAEFVLAHEEATSLAKNVASRLISGRRKDVLSRARHINDVVRGYGAGIRDLKARSIREPRNAFAWMELARLYVLNGMLDQAVKPVRIALLLAPHDRFIVRSASRFFLHSGKPDEALALLRRNAATPYDPWMTAAEIAISSVRKKAPRFHKEARAFLENKNFSLFHISETASALASLEMWDGNEKKAKRIFNKSLEDPTENALAQAIWASNEIGSAGFAFRDLELEHAFEAKALDSRNKGDWVLSVKHCSRWMDEEAFSSRPYSIASAIYSSLLAQPQEAEVVARRGLKTNPAHPGLLNNIAFALVEQGRPGDAVVELNKADPSQADDRAKACIVATMGLIEFRLGNFTRGRELYEKTIAYANRIDAPELRATAQLYLAREEARVGLVNYQVLLEQAGSKLRSTGGQFGKALVTRVEDQIKAYLIARNSDHIAKQDGSFDQIDSFEAQKVHLRIEPEV